ncbi:acyl-CoA--6-aminopenicillanic acid acyltransferase, partial [Staphylococcus condimenti]
HPATYDGRYLLYQPNDGGYAQIGPTSRVTGRMDGLNGAGLAMGYNFMHRKKPANGFVCYMIGRLILEICKNTE